VTDLQVRQEKIASLTWAIGLSALLAAGKAAAGFLCSSAALMASSLDSLMDTGISSVNYLSVLKGSKPPDNDHAYGHEKIESLASYTQGIIVLAAAAIIFAESGRRSWHPAALKYPWIALLTVVAACAVNLLLTFRLHRAEKRTDSLILRAEKAHYFSDFLSYVLIFAALLLVRLTGWTGWDVLGGAGVAAYVAVLAGRILWQAGNELVDRSLPPGALDELDRLIRTHKGVLSYHEIRTRKAGPRTFIDFHLVLEPRQSFEQAHEISEALIQKIRARFSNADITVHEDPEGGD
jgi:ferrous-iron efflux pump FieF